MKITLGLIMISFIFLSCRDNKTTGKFTLTGEIKNVPDQQIYLEQLYFSEQTPEVVDTGNIKNGIFSVTTIAPEEGLFRIRLEKNQGGYYFINDVPEIRFTADLNDPDLAAPAFDTKANGILKKFLVQLDTQRKLVVESNGRLEAFKGSNDSAISLEIANQTGLLANYNNFISNFIDTTSDPVVAMFVLGYTQGMDPQDIKKIVPGLEKRFPEHNGLKELVARVNSMILQSEEQQQQIKSRPDKPGIGSTAPSIDLPDADNKTFSLSQLKGKYVLVDFWASWCAPCRRENPNLVAAYKKYRNKNFTILGVSLDEDRNSWMKAIKNDKLDWQQISDLKGWNSAVVPLYGFDGIPYNVLIDPAGKIIGTLLRGERLELKLTEVLN